MADWRDDFREGSFRGVPFKTDSHEHTSGRRVVTHEFPTKEEGNSEDLGKRLPGYSLTLFVLGDDYFQQRDALKAALDQEGSGELIHPYLGKLSVQVGEYSLSETVSEGRMARFTVQFFDAGVPKFPEQKVDAVESVLSKADDLLGSAQSAFEDVFSVLNSPARVATAAANVVSDAADAVDNIAKTVGTSAQAVADVAFAIRNIKADINNILRTPDVLAQRFRDAFDLLFDAVEDNKDLSRALSGNTSSFAGDPIVGMDTPTSQKIQGNQLAVENMIVEYSVANQAKAAIQGNYISVDESIEIRELLGLDVQNHLEDISDDDVFQNIEDLLVLSREGLPPQNLGQLIQVTPIATIPALVLAHDLFGNIDKEDEIVEQNNIDHPGFVPGNQVVEVSSG